MRWLMSKIWSVLRAPAEVGLTVRLAAEQQRSSMLAHDLHVMRRSRDELAEKLKHAHDECVRLRGRVEQLERTQKAMQSFAVGRMES